MNLGNLCACNTDSLHTLFVSSTSRFRFLLYLLFSSALSVSSVVQFLSILRALRSLLVTSVFRRGQALFAGLFYYADEDVFQRETGFANADYLDVTVREPSAD